MHAKEFNMGGRRWGEGGDRDNLERLQSVRKKDHNRNEWENLAKNIREKVTVKQ